VTQSRPDTLRLVTFNVLHGRSPATGRVDPSALARAVRTLRPDVLALQEVDHRQPRSGGVDLTAVAADAMDAPAVRFAAALHGTGRPDDPWRRADGEDRDERPAYGLALLSRLPVTGWSVRRLPLLQPWPALPRPVRDEPRVALTAVIVLPGGPLGVTTTHLSRVPGWNAVQLRALRTSLAPRRAVLLGDLNLGARRARRVRGLHPLVDALTWPSDAPTTQLDHVLGTPDLRSAGGWASAFEVSDHRALVAEVLVSGG